MVQHFTPRTSSRRRMVLQMGAASAGLAFAPHALTAQDASPETGKVSVESGIVYGEAGGQSLVLEVYSLPPQDTLRPAVVLIHGGGWKYGIGGPADMALAARSFARVGYVSFNIEYRRTGDPAGEFRWPDQLDDVQRAVRWVRANAADYGVDPDRVGAYGHSAGGHLASHLAVRDTRDDSIPDLADISSRVACSISLAGQMDLLLPYTAEFDLGALEALLGGTAEEQPESYRDASPITWVDDATAPFLIIHGGNDSITTDHARTMSTALHAAGAEVVYAEFPTADHFMVADWMIAGPWALAFFDRHLDPSG